MAMDRHCTHHSRYCGMCSYGLQSTVGGYHVSRWIRRWHGNNVAHEETQHREQVMSNYTEHTKFPAYNLNKVYINPIPTNVSSVIIDGCEYYPINGEWVKKTLKMKGCKE